MYSWRLSPLQSAELFACVSFLSTSVGVRYLHEIEFIERELDRWFHVSSVVVSNICVASPDLIPRPPSQENNDLYVIQLELSLARSLNIGLKDTGRVRSDE